MAHLSEALVVALQNKAASDRLNIHDELAPALNSLRTVISEENDG